MSVDCSPKSPNQPPKVGKDWLGRSNVGVTAKNVDQPGKAATASSRQGVSLPSAAYWGSLLKSPTITIF